MTKNIAHIIKSIELLNIKLSFVCLFVCLFVFDNKFFHSVFMYSKKIIKPHTFH